MKVKNFLPALFVMVLMGMLIQASVGSAGADPLNEVRSRIDWVISAVADRGQGSQDEFIQPLEFAALGPLLADPICTDSDGGEVPDTAGYVEGIGFNGWPYTKYDACETGDFEGYLKEFYCNDVLFSAKRFNCDNGCLDGACITVPPNCTDSDADSYSIEGGACGLVDCDDGDAMINPAASEVCGNGVDDNCDGLIDSQDPVCLVCTDSDGDGYTLEGGLCGALDCDDTISSVHPGATEVCDNGIDDNCNGKIDAEDPACGAPPNVIIIGWDGVQRDHLLQCFNKQLSECANGLPNLAALGGGVIYDATTTNGGTATKPGWSQILTGYNAEVTGVFSNGDYQPIPKDYTVFEKLENHFGADNIVTMFISGKSVHSGAACIGDLTYRNGLPFIEDQGQPYCITKDYLDYYENDLRQNNVVGNRALELLETHQNDLFFAFILFRDPDVTGHLAGEDSIAYSNAMINDDLWTGNIINKLIELGIDDHTLIYVTSDHGFDEGIDRHSNAPFTIFVTNDPLVIREGDRKDVAPTILDRYGVGLAAIGNAPAVDGFSLYSQPPIACVAEGQAYIDYPGAPVCCSGLSLINLDKAFNANLLVPATGGTGDNSGYCTACGDAVCTEPENALNCAVDCN
jgi:hypothetical protein